MLHRDRAEALKDISEYVLELYQSDAFSIAIDAALAAIDLTNGDDLIKISPNGVSIGDRIKTNVDLKKRNTIPKSTPGNIVGFDAKSNRYLVLLFPVYYPHGVLALIDEKDLHFIMKPRIEENPEHIFASSTMENAPRSSILKIFVDEILAKSGLSVAGDWNLTNGSNKSWNLRGVIKKTGVTISKSNKSGAEDMVRNIVILLKAMILPEIKRSELTDFVEIISVDAWEAPISHPHITTYAALEIAFTTW